jgi:PAS domain S-box-containing protein
MSVSSGSEAGAGRHSTALLDRPSKRGTQRPGHGRAGARESAAPESLTSTAAGFEDLMARAPVAAFVKDHYGRYVYANPHLLATMGRHMGPDWQGKTDADMWPPEAAALMRVHDRAALKTGGPQVFSRVMPLEGGPHTVLLVEFPLPAADGNVGIGGIAVDITEYSNNATQRDQLAAVVEQATESVMIVDRDSRIIYVNPAFERVSGYTSAEVLGQNPRIISSGLQTPWFYDAMWAAITNGLPWVSDLVNRRKDGTLFTEEAIISAIHDPTGTISGYVAVKREVTQERALAERSSQLARERALMTETIRGVRAGDTLEATAQAICRRIVELTGISAAQFLLFASDGAALPISFVIKGRPDSSLHPPPPQRSRHLREKATDGPWIEPWINVPGHPYNHLMKDLRIKTVAYAPVIHDQKLVGVLGVDAVGSTAEIETGGVVNALVEFADMAGALIGGDAAEQVNAGRGRSHILSVIGDKAFQPVFQAIVDLTSDAVVGYEALTRFTDGANPELAFAEAASVGLGLELELATLQASLAAAASLPESAWLNLNASPELILSGGPLRSMLQASRRRLVLEVTEHTAIADYPAFRAAMAALGPNVELAVDDAGVGFASLRHILELHPAFVKLDRWLIADLESDEARKAMIVGLRHFASSTGCRLIAEGIETDREFAALRSLQIGLGQGYLLGRPLPIAESVNRIATLSKPPTPVTV